MLWQLSATNAVISCLGIATTFVGALYLLPKEIRVLDRDHPRHITARFACGAVACILYPTALYITGGDRNSDISLTDWLGLRTQGLALACWLPLSLFIGLFAGPLVNLMYLYEGGEAFADGASVLEKVDQSLDEFFPNYPQTPHAVMRNVVFAPIIEEFVFRCCMVPLLLCSGLSKGSIIIYGPLFFGVAHLHHGVRFVNEGQPVRKAMLIVGFQMLYTSMFGALEMFVFLRTGHFIAIALIHSWCNLLGLPSMEFLQPTHSNYKHRSKITVAYMAGIVFFCFALYPFTTPSLYYNKLWGFTPSSL